MLPSNTNNNKSCPYSTTSPASTSPTTVLDTSKATGVISPSTANSIQQLTSQSCSNSDPPSPVIASRIYPSETPPTQAQIDIVRYTWERISEIRHPYDDPNVSASHAFGLAFYDALFELDPTLRPLFTNIFQQATALAGMVSYIARAPNVTGPKPYRSPGHSPGLPATCISSNSCGFAPSSSSSTAPPSPNSIDRVLTIREINARKRKESTATTFSELVANVAAADVTPDETEGDPERLLYKLRELGARHYFYNVQPHQLALIGPAVLAAIKVRLGKEFLPEVAEAWTRAHAYAAYHMKIGLEAQYAWEQGRRKSAISKMSSNSSHGTKSNCTIQ